MTPGDAQSVPTRQLSFALAPDNYDGLKTKASLELGRHEYTQALETATKLNQQAPDDVMLYGYLVDANVELGNYKEAVAAAQWMLDLRAGNIPGLTRAAILRELHGNLNGALELLRTAYDSTPLAETEDRAALATRITSASSRGTTTRSATLPCSCRLSTGLNQKKSRDFFWMVFGSLSTGTSPNAAAKAAKS